MGSPTGSRIRDTTGSPRPRLPRRGGQSKRRAGRIRRAVAHGGQTMPCRRRRHYVGRSVCGRRASSRRRVSGPGDVSPCSTLCAASAVRGAHTAAAAQYGQGGGPAGWRRQLCWRSHGHGWRGWDSLDGGPGGGNGLWAGETDKSQDVSEKTGPKPLQSLRCRPPLNAQAQRRRKRPAGQGARPQLAPASDSEGRETRWVGW